MFYTTGLLDSSVCNTATHIRTDTHTHYQQQHGRKNKHKQSHYGSKMLHDMYSWTNNFINGNTGSTVKSEISNANSACLYNNNNNNNTSICKAHNVSIRAESEAPKCYHILVVSLLVNNMFTISAYTQCVYILVITEVICVYILEITERQMLLCVHTTTFTQLWHINTKHLQLTTYLELFDVAFGTGIICFPDTEKQKKTRK